MTTRHRILAAVAAMAMSWSVASAPAYAKGKKRPPAPRPAPQNPTPPATPPQVASPPALANEPEPMPVPKEAPPAAAPAAPAPTPPPEPPPPPKTKSTVELDALVNEYGAIRDELFRSRAKAAVLGEALLKTQLVVMFRYEAGRAWPLKKITLKLDERPVYSGDSVNGSDWAKIFETTAAAGRHVLTVRIEANGVGEDRISYATEDSFGFDLADNKLSRVELVVDETGSGPAPLAKKKQGSFDVRVSAKVKALELEKKQ